MKTQAPPHKRSSAAVGASLVVMSSLFYASYGIWATLMGDSFGSYIQAALRCVIVVGILLVIAMRRKLLAKVHWRRDKWWFLGMFISGALTSAPMYYAIVHTGIGLAMALSYIAIVLGMFVFGWIFSRERFTKDKLISTILGLVGIWLIFSPTLTTFGLLALGAALVSGLAIAFNIVMTQKVPYHATQSTILTWSIGLLVNLPIASILGDAIPNGPGVEWLYLVIFSLVSLIASWSVVTGSKLISAGAIGILGLSEVVFGLVFGVVFFGERLGMMVLSGMALIIVAAAIPYIQHLKVKDEPFELSMPNTKKEKV